MSGLRKLIKCLAPIVRNWFACGFLNVWIYYTKLRDTAYRKNYCSLLWQQDKNV